MLKFGDKASGILLVKSIKICGWDFFEGHDCNCDMCTEQSEGGICCLHCSKQLIGERACRGLGENGIEQFIRTKYNMICPKCNYHLDNDDNTVNRIIAEYGLTQADLR